MNNNVFQIFSLYVYYSGVSLSSVLRATNDVIYSRTNFALKEYSGLICYKEEQKWDAKCARILVQIMQFTTAIVFLAQSHCTYF